MVKAFQVKTILKWLILFTYVSATVLLIVNNNFNNLTYLIPLVLILFFVNYYRTYYLIENKKPLKYIVSSIILEMLLIICIGIFDKTEINILFFFVLVSSIVITFPFVYSILIAGIYILSGFVFFAQRNGFPEMLQSMVPMLFNYGVSTSFVMGMSYLVKMQIREKEKQAHINAELEQAYKMLIENSAAAQKLSIEEERTRMAREIHDTLAHTLTNLIVQLEVCKKLSAIDPSRLPQELEKAQELSRSGFNDIKRSIKALRPQVMEDKSFIASISSIINETTENTKVNITLNNCLSNDLTLTSQMEVALFRAVQESITNSIRHGQAKDIEMTLKSEKNSIELLVEDNGMGCTYIKKGYGTKGIRERIENLGGNVEFSSSYGKGFKTKISIPCEVA